MVNIEGIIRSVQFETYNVLYIVKVLVYKFEPSYENEPLLINPLLLMLLLTVQTQIRQLV